MSLKVFLLIIVTIVLKTDGQVPSVGRCTNQFKPMKDFQKLKFMGEWYEVERYYTMRDLIATCVSVTFDRFDDGRIYVNNEYTNRLTNRREVLTGKFKLIDGEDRGIFRVRYDLLPSYLNFNFLPDYIQYFNTTITVLHTDYRNFAILYSCRTLNRYGHADNSWLLTREKNPSEEVLQSAYGFLDKFGMRNYFIKSRQEGCA